jgi:hypothetical protein
MVGCYTSAPFKTNRKAWRPGIPDASMANSIGLI